jgi:hypothetical protein
MTNLWVAVRQKEFRPKAEGERVGGLPVLWKFYGVEKDLPKPTGCCQCSAG